MRMMTAPETRPTLLLRAARDQQLEDRSESWFVARMVGDDCSELVGQFSDPTVSVFGQNGRE